MPDPDLSVHTGCPNTQHLQSRETGNATRIGTIWRRKWPLSAMAISQVLNPVMTEHALSNSQPLPYIQATDCQREEAPTTTFAKANSKLLANSLCVCAGGFSHLLCCLVQTIFSPQIPRDRHCLGCFLLHPHAAITTYKYHPDIRQTTIKWTTSGQTPKKGWVNCPCVQKPATFHRGLRYRAISASSHTHMRCSCKHNTISVVYTTIQQTHASVV